MYEDEFQGGASVLVLGAQGRNPTQNCRFTKSQVTKSFAKQTKGERCEPGGSEGGACCGSCDVEPDPLL